MNTKLLEEKYHIDEDTGFRCRYVRSETEKFCLHSHNFYEIFMMVKGTAIHIINGKKQILKRGDLIFVRDFDIHDYKSTDKESFDFINLAIPKSVINNLMIYFNDDFSFDAILKKELPPLVHLSDAGCEKLFYRFMYLNNNDKNCSIRMKVLVAEVISEYFLKFENEKRIVPKWLEIVYEKMKKPYNFTEGVQKMYELSGKTREHVTRTFKNYYGITPSKYVNDLKLHYASTLLITSNLTVTDICYECGFLNLSWFNKQFVSKFGVSPLKYRKNNAKI